MDVTAVQRVNLLSEKYNIGKDRITALVKTGQVGETWEKLVRIPHLRRPFFHLADLATFASGRLQGLAPQNAFVRGMEDFLVVPKHKAGNSDAQRAFKDYLGSRIDIERDLEGARLARGELEVRLEDDGYGQARNSGKRLGALSWEFAAEGQTPLSTKMQLEKPLRPPPALPEFPSKLIGGGDSKAVDHVVDVGNKFRGQGWDGKINYEFYNKASGQGYPGHRNPIRKFVPVLTRQIKEANGIVTKTRNEKTAERRARRAALNAEGVLTPTQEILAKSMPGGVYDPTFVGKAEFHRRVFVAKLAAREKRVVKTRLRRRADMADAKAEFQQMVKDRINGKI